MTERANTSTEKQLEERVLTVTIGFRWNPDYRSEVSGRELKALVVSAGGMVCESVHCKLDTIKAATYMGQGKVREIQARIHESGCNLVVIDASLSPAQQRNLEKRFECRVIDRTGLILDIFARRARTQEGKIQVELAQLEYLLPRLTRMWTHLSRLGAGIGTRGPGETQLEVDRRRIRSKIEKLRMELKKVRNRRQIQRKGRRRKGFTSVVLVGYTNSGKSSLLNALTGSSVYVENQLFATLDSTIRLLNTGKSHAITISDTVGFISRLPTQLIAAFKATLEEVTEADLLLHVIDVSSDETEDQIREVMSVLKELKADTKPMIVVWNKIDVCSTPIASGENPGLTGALRQVRVSALTGSGIDELISSIREFETSRRRKAFMKIPYDQPEVLAAFQNASDVLKLRYMPDYAELVIRADIRLLNRYRKFEVSDPGDFAESPGFL